MATTLADLHRLSTHVLGRRRAAVSGHFGLRASPDGIATPAFGPEPEVLRLTATLLIREVGTDSSSLPLQGVTLDALAAFVGADLSSDYSAGADMPPLGSTSEPLQLDPDELVRVFDWFRLGWRVLDAVASDVPATSRQSTVQLWPEHFDVGTAVDFGRDDGVKGVNLGASAGDAFSAEPYVYVGPWGPERPGDPTFWNAPFGAFVARSEVVDDEACVAFLRTGLSRLTDTEA
jgi:hypothetical protein